MKNRLILSIIFLIGMLLIAHNSKAQLNDKSDKTKRQLSINANGEVLNDRGTKLGYISKEDIVFDHQDKKLGFLKNGKVYDAEGKPMGRVKKGGQYYNNEGVFVLETKDIGDQCEILDSKGNKMGTVHKNYKLHACMTHCFFKEKETNELK